MLIEILFSRSFGGREGAVVDIEVKLREYLKDNHLPKNSLAYSDEENLFDTGIIDSAGVISFISFIEDKFNITIPDEDLLPEHFASVTAISSYIKMRRRQSPQEENDKTEKMRSMGPR
jgi:acyl carrier protein